MTEIQQWFRAKPRYTIALATLAFILYVPAVSWGVPQATSADLTTAWGVDDVTPLGSLAQVRNIIEPQAFRNYGYPLLHPFLVVGAYAPYLGYLYFTGQFTTPSAEYPFGLADPVSSFRTMGIIAHLVSVVMGVGTVLFAFVTATTLWGRKTGLLAGVFALLSYPMFYYSRTGNVDVPMLFFVSGALASFATIIRRRFSIRTGVALGAFVGLALATKEPAFASFVLIPPAIVIREIQTSGSLRSLRTPAFWRATGGGLAACFLCFGFGSGLFVDPDWYMEHVRFASGRVAELADGRIADLNTFPRTWSGHFGLAVFLLARIADAMTPVGVALAGLGIALTWRQDRVTLWLAVPALTYLFVLFWMVRGGTLRYIMPVSLPLLLFAARGVVLGMERGVWMRRLAVTAAALTVIISFGQGLDLTHAMMFDSRYDASAWLEAEAESGDQVAYFGASQKLPYLEEGVTIMRAAEYNGAVFQADRSVEALAEIVDRLAVDRPGFVIVIPDHSSGPGEEHSASCPPELFAQLMDGTIGYRLAASFETAPLLPWLPRPELDYPSVNPPIKIFVPVS